VLVWNIHAGKDAAGANNLERVAALIRSQSPGIALIQEVDRRTRRSGGVDQIAELERLTGMHGAFGKSLDYDGGAYGIAILSRAAPRAPRTIDLPVTPPQLRAGDSSEPRIALAVSAPASGIDVAINTHIDAGREDHYRMQEAEHLASVVLPDRGRRLILGGDLNSTPDSRVHRRLIAAGLRDAWQLCGSGNGWTYPADTPARRIDYLYMTDALRCTAAAVLESTASDHRPLIFTVDARGEASGGRPRLLTGDTQGRKFAPSATPEW
jgi:endonuclease/exonuclease/phosphatase family metal-dependent hydrolase